MKISTYHIKQRNYWSKIISDITKIPVDDIMSRSRKENIQNARHLLAWSLYVFERLNTVNIGKLLRRNYRTVANSINVVYHVSPKGNPALFESKMKILEIHRRIYKNFKF